MVVPLSARQVKVPVGGLVSCVQLRPSVEEKNSPSASTRWNEARFTTPVGGDDRVVGQTEPRVTVQVASGSSAASAGYVVRAYAEPSAGR